MGLNKNPPPMRFMAMAMVSCVSREIAPSDMPPVQKRLMMSAAGSTCKIGKWVTALPNRKRWLSI